MNKSLKIAFKIAKAILADDETYIYDPEHEKKPKGGYHKTEKGWSKVDTSEKPEDKKIKIHPNRKKEIDRIVQGLFTEQEKTMNPRKNEGIKTEQEYYDKAIKSQKLMEEKLDNGNEESWLGRGSRRAEFTKEDIEKPGPCLLIAPTKNVKRAREKVKEYGGDWGKLTDAVRCSVAVDKMEDLPNVLEGLRSKGCQITTPPKNRFENRLESGYGDCLLNVDFGDGLVGEVQLHVKSMLIAKEFEGGHKLYESERSIYAKYEPKTPIEKYSQEDQESIIDLQNEQKKIYNRAYDKGITASMKKRTKYIMSDEKISYFLYDKDDFLAVCVGNNFPQYYAAGEWKEVKSFLKFADNARRISKVEFLRLAKEWGVPFDEE